MQTLYLQVNVHIYHISYCSAPHMHTFYCSAPHMHTFYCSTHTHAHFLCTLFTAPHTHAHSSLLHSHTCTLSIVSHTAWTGQFCEEDIDGCSVVSCFEGVQCTDVQAPGIGATCGPCPTGYTGDGVKCSGRWHLLGKVRLVIHLTT